MITIRVDNRIRLDIAELPDDVDLIERLKSEFDHENPSIAFKRRIGVPTYGEPQSYKTWKIHGRELSFPRGGMRRLREILVTRGLAYRVEDMRNEGGPNPRPPTYRGHEPRYYQREACDAAIKFQNCILRAPTGSGKTSMAFMLVSELKMNTIVILPTTALLKQWKERALAEIGIADKDLGIIQGKIRKLRPLTLAMQKTIAAHGVDSEMRDYFGAVICDEVQLFAAKTFFDSVDPFPAKYRIGISADERRKDRKEFLTHDLFGDVKHEVLRKTLEAEKHVMDVEIRVVPTDFRADWYGVSEGGEDDRKVDFNRLLNEMTTNEERNEMITDIALEEIRAGEQVIMLSHRREHCITLDRAFVAESVRSGYLIGGPDYEKEFDATKNAIVTGDVRVGIGTYLALGYGVDLPAVGIGFATTPIAANRQNFNQVRGRLCRTKKGKTRAVLYYFWDRHIYGLRHVKNLMTWNPSVSVLDNGVWKSARHYVSARKG